MKKILSLLTVSVLGVSSITNVVAFSQTKTNFKNTENNVKNWITGDDYAWNTNLNITINASTWNKFLSYKAHFNSKDFYGFGAYLAQFADNNEINYHFPVHIFPVVNLKSFTETNRLTTHMTKLDHGMAHTDPSLLAQIFCNDDNPINANKFNNFYQDKLSTINVKKYITLNLAISLNNSWWRKDNPYRLDSIKAVFDEQPSKVTGSGVDYQFNFSIQLNPTAWKRLLGYKAYFNSVNYYGFGSYLAQFANDNHFEVGIIMPNVPNANQIAYSNRLETHMGHFGAWTQAKNTVAWKLFNNEGGLGKQINYSSSWDNILQYIKFNFKFTYSAKDTNYYLSSFDVQYI